MDEQDAAITAEMSQRLEPLWAALSATITQIEANLPAHTDTSSEAPSAAASILPPGAAQVCHHPLCTLIWFLHQFNLWVRLWVLGLS